MAEDLHDLLGLSLAEQTVIDVYADQLLTDSLDEQGGNDGRIDAAGQCQQNLPVADLLAECGDLPADESLCDAGVVMRASDAGRMLLFSIAILCTIGAFPIIPFQFIYARLGEGMRTKSRRSV